MPFSQLIDGLFLKLELLNPLYGIGEILRVISHRYAVRSTVDDRKLIELAVVRICFID